MQVLPDSCNTGSIDYVIWDLGQSSWSGVERVDRRVDYIITGHGIGGIAGKDRGDDDAFEIRLSKAL